ncbi:cold shock domain-containing protein CG9705-like [Daphnia carinata]|uniref:cold shock domain-containing protein CG9705-like n=1 Tax=Daphnia carinata TaxID=120202 RepID=UPI00257E8F6B|nr:cold shock domain-containing protein CG9705-like [Daphnia carinata]XP_057376249.1 cold shock domain-containing protein CG9705-like [Daphnia carinata]
MSESKDQNVEDASSCPGFGNVAPSSSMGGESLSSAILPNPIITKRTRTQSMLELALDNPVENGVIKSFCRVKGHGFIKKNDGDEIFVHVSDIDGEYVPRIGDEVSFRKLLVPPKLEKFQAVHVQITNFTPEVHQRWTSALTAEESHEGSRPTSPSSMNVDS